MSACAYKACVLNIYTYTYAHIHTERKWSCSFQEQEQGVQGVWEHGGWGQVQVCISRVSRCMHTYVYACVSVCMHARRICVHVMHAYVPGRPVERFQSMFGILENMYMGIQMYPNIGMWGLWLAARKCRYKDVCLHACDVPDSYVHACICVYVMYTYTRIAKEGA